MNHFGLFEGIGGFSFAAQAMGWETKGWCEWDSFCQKVLKYHFPLAKDHGDIKKTDFLEYANRIDVLTGGPPCQPYSTAGKRKGKDDERHLWPDYYRAIKEIQPPWVVVENVYGLVNWNGGMVFNEIKTDLENQGYEVFRYVLPACGVNAPHKRYRVWFVAYSASFRCLRDDVTRKGIQRGKQACGKVGANPDNWSQSECELQSGGQSPESSNSRGIIANAECRGQSGSGGAFRSFNSAPDETWKASWSNDVSGWPIESPFCGGNDGLPTQLDGITIPSWKKESIKAFGNAIVPQVAIQIFKAIEQYQLLNKNA